MSNLIVSGKTIGQRKPLFADWSIPFPPSFGGGGAVTLRDVIETVVRQEVAAFRQRQEDRKVFRALTAKEINAAAARGKVEMGGSDVGVQAVDDDAAVAAALQAFEDGIYLVAIDGQEQRQLANQVFLKPDSRVTFIRLTLLAGG